MEVYLSWYGQPYWGFSWINRNLKRKLIGEKQREMLADQVRSMMQTLFPARDEIYQNDNAPIHASGLV
ncbi:hypothetical protein TNCV_68651 [Trichonephila clavipes]|nr:hypothetical protein TNCV_68651 [Trichonephila clavipes]